MKTPQFFPKEFTRLLERAAAGDSFIHCTPKTQAVLGQILESGYPEQEDDIEFLMDMVNYEMRKRNYSGSKLRFPAAKILNQLYDGPLYISMQ